MLNLLKWFIRTRYNVFKQLFRLLFRLYFKLFIKFLITSAFCFSTDGNKKLQLWGLFFRLADFTLLFLRRKFCLSIKTANATSFQSIFFINCWNNEILWKISFFRNFSPFSLQKFLNEPIFFLFHPLNVRKKQNLPHKYSEVQGNSYKGLVTHNDILKIYRIIQYSKNIFKCNMVKNIFKIYKKITFLLKKIISV